MPWNSQSSATGLYCSRRHDAPHRGDVTVPPTSAHRPSITLRLAKPRRGIVTSAAIAITTTK